MNNAKKISCPIIRDGNKERFLEGNREFQGCPSIAITKKGRIYTAWFAGGTSEPHIDNYCLVSYSDDGGVTWSKDVIIIPSDKANLIHAYDIQLWIDEKNYLHVCWTQGDVTLAKDIFAPNDWQNGMAYSIRTGFVAVGEYVFNDAVLGSWEMVCDNPDAEIPVFADPHYVGRGSMRNKPMQLHNGDWLLWSMDYITDWVGYSILDTKEQKFNHKYGPRKLNTLHCEAMSYYQHDGSIHMLARSLSGKITESISKDEGKTWSETIETDLNCANSRFYISRTPTGKLLLVHNDSDTLERNNMTVKISDDDGKTWKYSRCIDSRNEVSYPDVAFNGDKIYLVYDRERNGDSEILMAVFTEKDICDSEAVIQPIVISKPSKN